LKLRKITVATVALAAALTMSACSSDDGGSTETTAKTTTATTTTEVVADYPPVPTPEELQASLDRAFDETVPAEEKTDLVQGAELDPTLIDQVAIAAKQAGAVITIIDVNDNENGTATAGIETQLGDQVATGTVDFVAEDGVWKLSKNNACGIVAAAQLQTPACP
jgi:ABC-type glycerol-3-phosphate transport system substrate-binding protein